MSASSRYTPDSAPDCETWWRPAPCGCGDPECGGYGHDLEASAPAPVAGEAGKADGGQ